MKTSKLILTIGLVVFLSACVNIKQVQQALINLKRLKFKIENIENFNLNNINLQKKKSIKDFSLNDGMKLLQMYNSKTLPCNFILNVAAINPNDGTSGSKQANATITKLEWELFIDDKKTIDGIISTPIEIPGTGQNTIIPIQINIDLYKFFSDKSYDDIINLALALGGVNGSTARVKINLKPTVKTSFGNISYPGKFTVIDKEFSS